MGVFIYLCSVILVSDKRICQFRWVFWVTYAVHLSQCGVGKTRLQSKWRRDLSALLYWGCSVTCCPDSWLLLTQHIVAKTKLQTDLNSVSALLMVLFCYLLSWQLAVVNTAHCGQDQAADRPELCVSFTHGAVLLLVVLTAGCC